MIQHIASFLLEDKENKSLELSAEVGFYSGTLFRNSLIFLLCMVGSQVKESRIS